MIFEKLISVFLAILNTVMSVLPSPPSWSLVPVVTVLTIALGMLPLKGLQPFIAAALASYALKVMVRGIMWFLRLIRVLK